MKINKLFYIPAIFLLSCEPSVNKDSSTENTLSTKSSVFFRSKNINIGQVMSEDCTIIKYYAINTSDTPLIIDSVQSSCVCTISKFPKNPILKNDSGLIVAQFKPFKGHEGHFSKSIVVLANTKPAFTVLSFDGTILDKK